MRRFPRNLMVLAGVAICFGAAAMAAPAESLDGRWAATVVQNGVTIPFRLDISGAGKNVGALL